VGIHLLGTYVVAMAGCGVNVMILIKVSHQKNSFSRKNDNLSKKSANFRRKQQKSPKMVTYHNIDPTFSFHF
jgi:hypothetical protein